MRAMTARRARIYRLRLPVISVGNLSVGGSGKTPFVQTWGAGCGRRGLRIDILSRGYGRSSRGVLQVDAGLGEATGQPTALRPQALAGLAELYGDEPLLLARSLKVPVFVGEDRYEAGLAAEAWSEAAGHGTRVHILDDGFQHRRLHRDFDIVLLGAGDLRASLLPFGRLREPLASLGRAQAVAAPEELAALLAEPNVWHHAAAAGAARAGADASSGLLRTGAAGTVLAVAGRYWNLSGGNLCVRRPPPL